MTNSGHLHIVIAAGGTGGHFYPALAVATECRERGHDVTLVIAGHHVLEHRQEAVENGFKTFKMTAPKFPDNPLKVFKFLFSFRSSYSCARRILHGLDADIVLGMGSFACFPLCMAAVKRRIPLLLHEGNTVVGRANRFLSRWAAGLANSLPLLENQQPLRCDSTLTGLPIRKNLELAAGSRQAGERESTLLEYGLATDKPTLLVFGGSQGASSLNELVCKTFSEVGSEGQHVQVIHISGESDFEKMRRFYDKQGITAYVCAYEQKIELCYQASDLALCRSGASSIAELALFGVPGIFIPLPSAADQHQFWNAWTVRECNGGYVIDQTGEAPEKELAAMLSDWLAKPEKWEDEHGRNIQRLAQFEAAAKVADLMEKTTLNKSG